jgi:undecaprenyl-diphosphatase
MKPHVKHILPILIVLLLGLFLLRSSSTFNVSFSTITSAQPQLILLAVIISSLTFVFAAASYTLLALHPVAYKRTLLIQVASSFASKLLPAGAGGIAVNMRFLQKSHHTIIEAGAVVGVNNLLSVFAHLSVLFGLVVFGATSFSEAFTYEFRLPAVVWYVAFSMFALLVLVLYLAPAIRKNFVKKFKKARLSIVSYRTHPFKLLGSLFALVGLTLAYTAVLFISALAFEVHLSVLQVMLIFSIGVVTASVTPTPGGIGGAEAGLVAGLAAAGVSADLALSITLLYRLITYWLPIVPGFIALQIALKKQYL